MHAESKKKLGDIHSVWEKHRYPASHLPRACPLSPQAIAPVCTYTYIYMCVYIYIYIQIFFIYIYICVSVFLFVLSLNSTSRVQFLCIILIFWCRRSHVAHRYVYIYKYPWNPFAHSLALSFCCFLPFFSVCRLQFETILEIIDQKYDP